MVNSLEFCVLVGTDHSAGRLVGRCIVKAESSSPARAAALWMVALILGLVRKFMRTKVRSSELQGSDWEETAMVTRNHQSRSVASSASISALLRGLVDGGRASSHCNADASATGARDACNCSWRLSSDEVRVFC